MQRFWIYEIGSRCGLAGGLCDDCNECSGYMKGRFCCCYELFKSTHPSSSSSSVTRCSTNYPLKSVFYFPLNKVTFCWSTLLCRIKYFFYFCRCIFHRRLPSEPMQSSQGRRQVTGIIHNPWWSGEVVLPRMNTSSVRGISGLLISNSRVW